ncbi:hypothetical protein V8E51_002771 [Hyaloscypha variabilis]
MPQSEPSDLLGATNAPTYELYTKRRELLACQETHIANIPTGFPLRVDLPSVWSKSSLNMNNITYNLTAEDIHEIMEALSTFKGTRASLNELSPLTFQLPKLSMRLKKVSDEIFQGRGLAILRGLNPDLFSIQDNVIIHAGISSYIAPLRGNQSGFNDQVLHVCNREDGAIRDLRGNSTAAQLAFHVDDTDVLGFYVVERSSSGGEMLWASHTQVYNDLAANRPEVLRNLADDQWPLRTATPMGEPAGCVRLPLLYLDQEGPYFWLARGNLIGGTRAPRDSSLPPLTLEQADALDAIHFTALKYAVSVTPQKGEMYFLNNLSVMHSRTAFVDRGSQNEIYPRGSRRHLLRLWLRDPARGRAIDHPVLRRRWDDVFDVENARSGRWELSPNMKAEVVSHCLFKGSLPVGTISTSEH